MASAHGLTATAEFGMGYPVTVNDADQAEFAQSVVTGLLGAGRFVPKPYPLTGSEDFSYVLQEVPGAFLMLGACLPGNDPATAAVQPLAGGGVRRCGTGRRRRGVRRAWRSSGWPRGCRSRGQP